LEKEEREGARLLRWLEGARRGGRTVYSSNRPPTSCEEREGEEGGGDMQYAALGKERKTKRGQPAVFLQRCPARGREEKMVTLF